VDFNIRPEQVKLGGILSEEFNSTLKHNFVIVPKDEGFFHVQMETHFCHQKY